MSKKKKNQNVVEICDSIMDYYDQIAEYAETPVKMTLNKINMLVENRYALAITGRMDTYRYRNLRITKYNVACKFMCDYNKSNEKFLVPIRANRAYVDDDKDLSKVSSLSFNDGTYFAKLDKKNYAVLVVNSPDCEDEDIKGFTLYFVGKNFLKWKSKYFDMYDKYQKITENSKIQTIFYTKDGNVKEARFKPMSNVVFSGIDEKGNHITNEEIVKYIDNWVDGIPTYYKYGMIPKLSILLYGEPGTGKSTFAKAVAEYLGINCVTAISPDYFQHDDDDMPYRRSSRMRGMINNTRSNGSFPDSVIVIDEIDCICKSREKIDERNDLENRKILQNVLEFLDNPETFYFKAKDGIYYPISIVIATTNYFNDLDKAVIRSGRFDKKIEVLEFGEEEARKMCDLYSLKLEDVVKHKIEKGFKISPSDLDTLCGEMLDKSIKNKKK